MTSANISKDVQTGRSFSDKWIPLGTGLAHIDQVYTKTDMRLGSGLSRGCWCGPNAMPRGRHGDDTSAQGVTWLVSWLDTMVQRWHNCGEHGLGGWRLSGDGGSTPLDKDDMANMMTRSSLVGDDHSSGGGKKSGGAMRLHDGEAPRGFS